MGDDGVFEGKCPAIRVDVRCVTQPRCLIVGQRRVDDGGHERPILGDGAAAAGLVFEECRVLDGQVLRARSVDEHPSPMLDAVLRRRSLAATTASAMLKRAPPNVPALSSMSARMISIPSPP